MALNAEDRHSFILYILRLIVHITLRYHLFFLSSFFFGGGTYLPYSPYSVNSSSSKSGIVFKLL